MLNNEELYKLVYDQIITWNNNNNNKPLIIGISGSQGIGKTTLTKILTERFSFEGYSSTAISIDDFYYKREDQIKLSNTYSNNILLEERGYPGTHDIELGIKTLNQLKLNTEKYAMIPVYDKSKHMGKGDRLPENEWKKIDLPIDIVILEGWMLGFKSTSSVLDENFKIINDFLKSYSSWYSFIDKFIYLIPEKIEHVIDWRIEAEENMKKSGKTGMTREEVEKYVKKFIRAYETYLPDLIKNKTEDTLIIKISKLRQIAR